MFAEIDFSGLREKVLSLWKQLLVGVLVGAVLVGVFAFKGKLSSFFASKKGVGGFEDVAIPSIVNGELVLPKVTSLSGGDSSGLSLGGKVGVVSANLVPVFDQNQKLSALRIIGEMQNGGERTVDGLSPYVRFFDADGKVAGQKIGQWTAGFTFFGLLPSETSVYDVTVESPPVSDKLEIALNVASSTDSAIFDELKIASRSMEVKTATYQGSGGATDSAGQQIEYYTVSGRVVNALSDPASDIAVYAWAKDREGKVFSFAKQDFKNDLLSPGDRLDFRLNLLPFKGGAKYDSYEVAAWGKRYKLSI